MNALWLLIIKRARHYEGSFKAPGQLLLQILYRARKRVDWRSGSLQVCCNCQCGQCMHQLQVVAKSFLHWIRSGHIELHTAQQTMSLSGISCLAWSCACIIHGNNNMHHCMPTASLSDPRWNVQWRESPRRLAQCLYGMSVQYLCLLSCNISKPCIPVSESIGCRCCLWKVRTPQCIAALCAWLPAVWAGMQAAFVLLRRCGIHLEAYDWGRKS